MNLVPVTHRLNPFSCEPCRVCHVEPGSTVLDAVRAAGADEDLFPYLVVMVGGEIVDVEWWARVRPKEHSCITIHTIPRGGKVGRIAAIAAAVLVIAAASAVSAGILGPVAAGTIGTGILGPASASFAAGSLGATLLAAGIATAGSLAVYALTPTPNAPATVQSTMNSKAMAGVSGNLLTPYDYLPAVFGKVRMSPPLLAPAYTDLNDGGQQYANAICGLFGQYLVENVQVNGIPVEDFDDVTWEVRRGLASEAAPTQNFTTSHKEVRPGVRFSTHDREYDSDLLIDQVTPQDSCPKWHFFDIPPIGNDGEILVRVIFPIGLVMDGSSPNNGACGFIMDVRQKGSDTWYELPEVMFRGSDLATAEVRQQIRIRVVSSLAAATVAISSTKATYGAWWRSNVGGTFERTAESVYTGASFDYAKGVERDGEIGWIVDILETALNFDGDLEFRIKKGTNFGLNNFAPTTYLHNGAVDQAAFYNYYTSMGNALSPSKERNADNCILESVRN